MLTLPQFRFVDEEWWSCNDDPDNLEAMRAFYDYSEPFSAECRAFGRLQESDHQDLAIPCFGYILLDEQHERALMDQFKDALWLKYIQLDFNGAADMGIGNPPLRPRLLGRDGREAPIRGIVKAVGPTDEHLRDKDARRILRDMISLQQLGIISLDPQYWQFVSGKFCDFSTAVTTPHFMTSPELSPSIAPEWIPRMEFATFNASIHDFHAFDNMVLSWNNEHDDPKDKLSVWAFPGGKGGGVKYNLRSTPARECVYSFVDPRRYDWRPSATVATRAAGHSKANRGAQGLPRGTISKPRRRLVARPPRWIYYCEPGRAEWIRRGTLPSYMGWEYKDGRFSPRELRQDR